MISSYNVVEAKKLKSFITSLIVLLNMFPNKNLVLIIPLIRNKNQMHINTFCENSSFFINSLHCEIIESNYLKLDILPMY